jgi:FMN-dependent oxidoreductase (nitrilotriacetate monooxygenase family)
MSAYAVIEPREDAMLGRPLKQLKLSAILHCTGTDYTTWQDPEIPGNASTDINWYVEYARAAEAEKFDFLFIFDSPFTSPDTAPHYLNRLEPLTLLSAVAFATSRIGLVATLTTSYFEPYNVARQLASLDLISAGRAGWNVVTTGLEAASRNYGRDLHFEHKDRYARAMEFVQVVQGLWDSYEDDAFPYDKESGIFLNKARQHALNHKGKYYSVAGPLAVSRSAQGQPVICQAGDSAEGRNLGAHIADIALPAAQDFDSALAYSTDIKARAARLGRNPDDIVVMAGLSVILADTDEEAREREDKLVGKIDFETSLVELGRFFNYHDFRGYDPDAPFPEVSTLSLNSYKGQSERIVDTARTENLTLRQTAERFIGRRSPFVGRAETIANEMERWFRAGAVDGFMLSVARPKDFALFCERVLPILRARGLFRTEYEHDTLRGNLGLPIPANRYTAARQQAVAAE